MTRLVDRLLESGFPRVTTGSVKAQQSYYNRCDDMIDRLLEEPPVIVVDNVAEFLFNEEKDGKSWRYDTDFPNIAPPFSSWWMEYKVPRNIEHLKGLNAIGVFVNIWDMQVEALMPDNLLTGAKPLLDSLPKDRPPRWLCQWQMVMEGDGAMLGAGAAMVMVSAIAEDGKPIGGVLGSVSSCFYTNDDEKTPKNPTVIELVGTAVDLLHPMLLALSMMHCRNVTLVEGTIPRHERRRAEKEKVRAPLRFSTVNIAPMTRILRDEGKSGSHGLQKAMHICRGHFKHFDEKPLFGRVTGTFWWGSMVRGTSSRGKVVHDYEVKP